MAKRGITAAQRADIKRMTKTANERLRSATSGQRSYLEFQVNKATGAKKFSAATKGMTYTEAKHQLETLQRFLDAKTSTKRGWKALKKQQVEAANARWKSWGYTLTDGELALILEQIDTKNKNEYYAAVDKVQAAKFKGGGYKLNAEEIAAAINEKISEQQAVQSIIKARGKK